MSGNTTIPGPHGTTINFSVSGAVTQAIATAFAKDLLALFNQGQLDIKEIGLPMGGKLKLPGTHPGKTLELTVNDTTAGTTATLDLTSAPNGSFIINASAADLIIDASGDPNLLSTGIGATTYFGGAGGGNVAAVVGAGNQYFQALGSGGGDYAVAYSSGANTVWASSGNDQIQPGSGNNLVGLGSGNNVLVDSGSDTVFSGGGHATVFAGTSDLLFGPDAGGSLLFVGGGAGSRSTLVGGAGSATLFGTGGANLIFAGTGSLLLAEAAGGSDTIVAGAGAASVAAFGSAGANIVLFSGTDHNLLIGGFGNETLNAGGSSGSNAIFAGSGAESLIGGSGVNVFAFAAGGLSAGGDDTIGNWTDKDTLALFGYAASGFTQTTIGGNAVITLSDNTRITIAGVSSIPNAHVFLS